MFSYYGAKTKIVKHYPHPEYGKIVEPFAGSARYSLRHYELDIELYETYIKPFKIWEYLIQASRRDILSLPNLKVGDDIRLFTQLSDAERWLIGYQLGRGAARPSCIVNERCRWNVEKHRIAADVEKIKHWKIYNTDGMAHDWNNATYFVDPPYMVQKHGYNHGKVDYNVIAQKINDGNAHFIVCGNADDTWLNFKPLVEMHGTNKTHLEMIYVKGNHPTF